MVWTLGFAIGCGESEKTDSSEGNGNSGTGAGGTTGTTGGSAGATQGGASSGAGSGGGSSDSVPLDMLGDAYARAECARLARCSNYPALIEAKVPGGCVAIQAPSAEDHLVAKISRAIDAGRAEYDPRAMAECLERLANLDCAEPLPDCEDAIQGTVPAGGDCLTDFECAGDADCARGDPIDEECSEWICVPRVAPDSCACEPGFSCVVDELGNATCEADIAEGVTCTLDGLPCRGSLRCAVSSPDLGRTCERFRDVALGEPCDQESRRCAPDARCMIVGGTSEADFDYRCLAPAPSGGTCHIGLLDDCPMGEYCPLAYADLQAGRHTATCLPSVADGEACSRDFSTMCTLPSTCSAGVCEPPPRLGEACSSTSSCVSERCAGGLCVVETPC